MSLKNMTPDTGATVSSTGGTALNFADDGQTVNNGVHLVNVDNTDYKTRESVVAKYRAPRIIASSGEYTKDKKTLSYTVPMVTAAGDVVFNVIRIEREVHPELSAADAVDMLNIAAQLCFNTDVTNFWAYGSLS